MILGMSVAAFTLVHVVLSLLGIISGIVVLWGMFGANRLDGWTAFFLATTVATSVTGFLFHSASFGPPHVRGAFNRSD
jgi:putative flippase GtrA